MLTEYFADIVGEIKRFSDEDRILYQFRAANAVSTAISASIATTRRRSPDGDRVVFEIGPRYRDPARYPIDFFVMLDDALHIIPVEALKDGRIARADLPKWRARDHGPNRLPASFRTRFAREKIAVGQPMT